MCKKYGTPERKYKLHSSENFFRHRSNHESIKEGLGGSLGDRDAAVKQSQKSKKKWKRELKSLRKQNKIIYSTEKHSTSHHELKNINNIFAKVSEKNDSP